MSGRPLLVLTLPLLTVLAICLYLRRRARNEDEPPEPPPDQSAEPAEQQAEPAEQAELAAARDLGQVTAWVRDNIETQPEPASPAGERQQVAKEQVREPKPTQKPEPAQEPAHEAAQEPVREAAQEPVREAARGPVREAAQEPAREAAQEPVREAAQEPVREAAQEPVREAAQEPVREAAQEPVREAAQEPVREAVQEPVQEAVQLSSQQSVQQSAAPAKAQATTVTAPGPQTPERVVEDVCEKTAERGTEAHPPARLGSLGPGGDTLQQTEAAVSPSDAPADLDCVAGGARPRQSTPVEAPGEPLQASTPAAGAAEVDGGRPAAAGPDAEPAPEPAQNGHQAETAADNASENSSDSGKGGSSASLEHASPSNSPEAAAPLQTAVYDFLIPQKLCGRLIGKNGTFVNLLKARTGANVIIRLHPVKSSVKICSVDGTQSEIDACLKMIREKFPVTKFPTMTLERLNRPAEQALAVPDSQQLHLPQAVTCDVLVSAVVSAGQLVLQQHTHPTFRGLERLGALMNACYGSGETTPELPRPVLASSICAAPVAGGWYRAQAVAYYPDSDELDVRFMDYGGYSRLEARHVRQIRTDFMSLPFQAEECYLANVMPLTDDGWSVEAGAVLENLIADRALEAMVVGYAEDGTPFVNLYTIQVTEYGNSAISLVNQQLVESGAARWFENQA